MKRPDFFIVGAPKCGTTAMNDYLAQHPDIFMATKELHYFGSDLQLRHKISEEEYLQHFENAGNKKIFGEASVWYLFSKTAAEEIRKFSPSAKVLIMLRNPVDVIYSLHSQNLYDGNEDVTDFETALNLDEERKSGIHQPRSVHFLQIPPYRDAVLFSDQVKRYFNVFGRDNVHVVLYDDFVADTEKIVLGVLKFLDVSTHFKIDYKLINPNKKIRFFHLHKIMKHPSVLLKKTVRLVLPVRKVRHEIMKALFKWNIKFGKRKKMRSDLSISLKHFFAEDVKSLGGLIHRDLSGWIK